MGHLETKPRTPLAPRELQKHSESRHTNNSLGSSAAYCYPHATLPQCAAATRPTLKGSDLTTAPQ